MFFQSPNDYLDSFRKKIYWWFQNSVLSEPNPFDHSIFVFLVDQIIPVLMELFPFFFRAKWSSFKGEIHLRKKSLFGIFVIPSFFFFFFLGYAIVMVLWWLDFQVHATGFCACLKDINYSVELESKFSECTIFFLFGKGLRWSIGWSKEMSIASSSLLSSILQALIL